MIQLRFQQLSEDRYLFWQGNCFGPYGPNGIFEGDAVEFNSTLRSLEQSPGIYGDNNVDHQEIKGEFEYHPLINGCFPAPTATHPRRTGIPWKDYYNVDKIAYATEGLAAHKGSTMYYSTDFRYVVQYATSRNQETLAWTMWRIEAPSGLSRATAVYRYDMTSIQMLSIISGTVYVKARRRQYSPSLLALPSFDWSKQQCYDDIVGMVEGKTTIADINVSEIGYLYKVRIPSYTTSPSDMKMKIDGLIRTILPKGFPIEDYPYGDLCMRALNQVDSNHTNMLEFLKDLKEFRHPTKIISKLRNLAKLKGLSTHAVTKKLSSAYLGVKYGVLPTISDVEAIVEAFKKRAPYLDRNGFQIYSAGETTESTTDGLKSTLVQYAKVALDREDNEFLALVRRFEDMGVWPSFENLWDLVPYSFAIDWLIDVGELLKRVDTNLRILRLPIRYVTMSRKTTIRGASSTDTLETPFVGTIDWTRYHRWVSDQCPGPTLSLNRPTQPFTHWVEAGALILQRT